MLRLYILISFQSHLKSLLLCFSLSIPYQSPYLMITIAVIKIGIANNIKYADIIQYIIIFNAEYIISVLSVIKYYLLSKYEYKQLIILCQYLSGYSIEIYGLNKSWQSSLG